MITTRIPVCDTVHTREGQTTFEYFTNLRKKEKKQKRKMKESHDKDRLICLGKKEKKAPREL